MNPFYAFVLLILVLPVVYHSLRAIRDKPSDKGAWVILVCSIVGIALIGVIVI
jgi:succinate dehydrogenase/fumarate reductase cytochrome b subunit